MMIDRRTAQCAPDKKCHWNGTVCEPFHNQPSLQQTCSRCGGAVCFRSLFSCSVWLGANFHTLVKQNIQIRTAMRLGVYSLINSETSQWEHSDLFSSDERPAQHHGAKDLELEAWDISSPCTDLTVLYLMWKNSPYSSETIDIGAGVGFKTEVRRKRSDRGGMWEWEKAEISMGQWSLAAPGSRRSGLM